MSDDKVSDAKKQELQRKYVELQILQQQMMQIQRQSGMIESQIEEMLLVQQALDDFAKAKRGDEMFVTLTPGILVKAKLEQESEVLLNVGAGAVVQKKVPDAKRVISEQESELKKVNVELAQQLEKLVKRAKEIGAELK